MVSRHDGTRDSTRRPVQVPVASLAEWRAKGRPGGFSADDRAEHQMNKGVAVAARRSRSIGLLTIFRPAQSVHRRET